MCCNSQTRRESTGQQTSEGAIDCYESYVEDLQRRGFLLQEHLTAEAAQLASEKLQAVSCLQYGGVMLAELGAVLCECCLLWFVILDTLSCQDGIKLRQMSCFSLLNAEILDGHHHTQMVDLFSFLFFFLLKKKQDLTM